MDLFLEISNVCLIVGNESERKENAEIEPRNILQSCKLKKITRVVMVEKER